MDEPVNQSAFVLRIAPSRINRLPEALESDELIIGWSKARGLLDKRLTWEGFRKVIHDEYHAAETSFQRSGRATGHMWRFVREMEPGTLIVVPYGSGFYVAMVTGPATYDETRASDDTAYRRPVEWLNAKQAIQRKYAPAALQSRLKVQGTTADASDLVEQILQLLAESEAGEMPTFAGDLRRLLIDQTLDQIQSGRMNERGFEELVGAVLQGLGAASVAIIPRQKDKGADILAKFKIADTFDVTLAVQAKYYKPDPPTSVESIEQLRQGMAAESADWGMVVTAGVFSEEATTFAEKLGEEEGLRIELVDGEQLATLIVDHGLTGPLTSDRG